MVSRGHGTDMHSQHQTGQLQGAGTKCLRARAKRVQLAMSESWKGTMNLCIQVILIIVLTCPHLAHPLCEVHTLACEPSSGPSCVSSPRPDLCESGLSAVLGVEVEHLGREGKLGRQISGPWLPTGAVGGGLGAAMGQ